MDKWEIRKHDDRSGQARAELPSKFLIDPALQPSTEEDYCCRMLQDTAWDKVPDAAIFLQVETHLPKTPIG